VVAKSSARYLKTPHAVPIANVNANPANIQCRHALNHATAKMPKFSTA